MSILFSKSGKKGFFAESIFAIGSYQKKLAEFNFAIFGQNSKIKFRKNFFCKIFFP